MEHKYSLSFQKTVGYMETFNKMKCNNMMKLMEDVRLEGNDTFEKLVKYYDREEEERKAKEKGLEEVLNELREIGVLKSVVLLAVFKAGIKEDEINILERELKKLGERIV